MAISNRNNKRLYEKLAELPNDLRHRIEQQSRIAELIFSNLGVPTSSVQLQSGVLESFQDASSDTSPAHKVFEQCWWVGIVRAQKAYVERFEQCLQVLTGRLAERGLTPPIELVRDVVMVTLDEAARIIGERPSALDMVIDVLPVLMKNAAEIFEEEFIESE